MIEVDQYKHPGLYRYSSELLQYPELTEEQYAATVAELESSDETVRTTALERLICAHLGMVLAMGVNAHWRYNLSLEDFVGRGNEALVMRAGRFRPLRDARFSTYMRTVISRWVLAHIRDCNIRDWNEDVGVDAVGMDSSELLNAECIRKIHEAIATLTREEQMIVTLLYFSHGEPELKTVAERLRRTPDGLQRSLATIYDKLRPLLQEVRFPRQRIYITPEDDTDEDD